MKTFKLDPAGFTAIRKKSMSIGIPFMLISGAAGIYISIENDTNDTSTPEILPFLIPILLAAMAIGGYRGLKKQRHMWDSYRLILNEDIISRVQNETSTITIRKPDITEITETRKKHLQIKTGSRHTVIHIPSAIEDRDGLLVALSEFGSITKQETKNKWVLAIPVLTLVFMVVFFVSKHKIVIISTGTLLMLGLVWSFFEVQRSKLVDKKTKRSVYFLFLVIIAIAVRILTTLNLMET